MPRCAQILYAETAKRCLPACRGRWPRRGRRGCTVGSCRGLSNDDFYRIDSVHPLSHGLWPMTAPPTQGSLFSVPFGPASISTAQASEADGRGMPRPYKPSPEDLQKIEDYTPSVCLYRQTAPPTQGSHTPRRFCVWNLSGRGMPPPLHAKTILRPAPTPALPFSLFSFLLLK